MIMMMVDIMLTWVTLKEGDTRAICKLRKINSLVIYGMYTIGLPNHVPKYCRHSFILSIIFSSGMPDTPIKTSPDRKSLINDGLL